MKLRGDFDGTITYNVGDVVRAGNGDVCILEKPCKAGTLPIDTTFWGKAGKQTAEIVSFILDALEIESGNNPTNLSDDALILKSSTEGSELEFIITVDDDGELTATELE